MKHLAKLSVAGFCAVMIVALTPSTAQARGSVHIDIPGISIGVHDDHRYRHKRKYRQRRDHYNSRYRDRRDNYYRERRKSRRDNRRNRYSNDYYYGGGNNYYERPRRTQVCPTYGYSRYYVRDRGCYRHKGHYHCD